MRFASTRWLGFTCISTSSRDDPHVIFPRNALFGASKSEREIGRRSRACGGVRMKCEKACSTARRRESDAPSDSRAFYKVHQTMGFGQDLDELVFYRYLCSFYAGIRMVQIGGKSTIHRPSVWCWSRMYFNARFRLHRQNVHFAILHEASQFFAKKLNLSLPSMPTSSARMVGRCMTKIDNPSTSLPDNMSQDVLVVHYTSFVDFHSVVKDFLAENIATR